MRTKVLTNNDIEKLEIEMTLRCQLKCHYCDKLFKLRSNVDIDLQQLQQLLHNFKNLKFIQICGLGEPTLHPYLFDAIQFMHSLPNVKIQLVTNGTARDLSYYSKLSNMLNSNDSILFSMYGTTNSLHSYYRIGQSLDNLFETIRVFKQSKAKVILEYVQMEYNHSDFEKCFNNQQIIQDIFTRQNIEIHYLHDCWTIYERFNYKPAKDLKICTKSIDCARNMHAMNTITLNDNIAKTIFWCNSYNDKSLYIDSHCRIFPCPDMRMAADSIDIQKILLNKHKASSFKEDNFKASKQFVDLFKFDYSDIYALSQYRELCNQVDYITLKKLMYANKIDF